MAPPARLSGPHPLTVAMLLVVLVVSAAVIPATRASASPPASVAVGPAVDLSRELGNQMEASVAIDPSNPRRMFVLGRDEAGNLISSRSSDGGVTWTSSRVGTTITNGGLPPAWGNASVAFDQWGNLFVAFLGSGQWSYADFAMSTDGGATFIDLTALSRLADMPKVAVGGGAVWVTYNVGGVNWVQGAPVTGPGAIGAFTPAEAVPLVNGQGFGGIAVGPSGEVMVAFGPASVSSGSITLSVDPDGLGPAGFGPPVTVSTTRTTGFTFIPAAPDWGIDSGTQIAVDLSRGPHHGRVYVAYLDSPAADPVNTVLYVRYSDDGGTSWSTPSPVADDTGNASHLMPALAVDQTTGAVAATWYDTRNDPSRVSVQYFGSVSVDGGVTWGSNFALSPGSTNSNLATPLLIRDTDLGDYTGNAFLGGRLVGVWADNSNSTGDNPAGAGSSLDLYAAVSTVTLPSVAPTVSITLQPVPPSGWFTAPVTATVGVTAGGSSVVTAVQCNGAPVAAGGLGTATATASVTLATEGLNSLSCTGTDADGATASAGSGPVQIDSVAPTVTIVLSAPVVPRGGTLTVTASATDATSGVATTTCGSPVTTSIGVFPVMCQAADLAGNVASAVAYYQVVAPYDLAVTAPATTERPDSFTVTARLSDYTGAGVPGVSAASTVTVRLGSGRTVTLHYRPVSDTFTGVVTVPRTAALGPTPLSATATSSGRSLASASRSVLVLAR